jgi:hypothetical protein
MSIIKDVADFRATPGENLLIWRRRQGLTQDFAATMFKVSVDRYQDWETDRSTLGRPKKRQVLKIFEICFLKRRRSGMTQAQVASSVGVCKFWIVKMEVGEANINRLRDYWGV